MKRLTAVLIIPILVVSLILPVSASMIDIDTDNNEGGAYYYPGKTYIFELNNGSRIEDEFYEYYRTRIQIVQGASYISTCSIQEDDDGYYNLVFRSKTTGFTDPRTIELNIIVTDKETRDDVDSINLSFDVGYGDEDYCNDDEFDVDPSTPIVEVDSELTKVLFSFGNYATYLAKMSNKTKFNLGFTANENYEITRSNSSAELRFLQFNATPVFDVYSDLSIYAPEAKYLYEVGKNNSLTLLESTKSGDYIKYRTIQLTSYVTSDIKLSGASSTSSSSSSSTTSSASSSTTSSSSGGKVNVNTGARLD